MLFKKKFYRIKNDYQFFDALKTKDCKIRGNCNFINKSQISWIRGKFSFKSKLCYFFIQNDFILYWRTSLGFLILNILKGDIELLFKITSYQFWFIFCFNLSLIYRVAVYNQIHVGRVWTILLKL